MAIQDIITQLAALEATITGIKNAYDETPEALGALPAFINYPRLGRLHFSTSDGKQNDHTIRCDLLVARGHLPKAENLARPFIDLFQVKLAANFSLGGTVSTIKEIRYDYGVIEYAGESFVGIRFEVDVKEIGTITVAL